MFNYTRARGRRSNQLFCCVLLAALMRPHCSRATLSFFFFFCLALFFSSSTNKRATVPLGPSLPCCLHFSHPRAQRLAEPSEQSTWFWAPGVVVEGRAALTNVWQGATWQWWMAAAVAAFGEKGAEPVGAVINALLFSPSASDWWSGKTAALVPVVPVDSSWQSARCRQTGTSTLVPDLSGTDQANNDVRYFTKLLCTTANNGIWVHFGQSQNFFKTHSSCEWIHARARNPVEYSSLTQ